VYTATDIINLLNVSTISFLTFYRKRFGEATEKAGLVHSMVLSLLRVKSVYVKVDGGRWHDFAQTSLRRDTNDT
jgi:hypothetical protein